MCIVYKNNPFYMMIHIILCGKMWLRKSLQGLKYSSNLEFKLMKRKIYFIFLRRQVTICVLQRRISTCVFHQGGDTDHRQEEYAWILGHVR